MKIMTKYAILFIFLLSKVCLFAEGSLAFEGKELYGQTLPVVETFGDNKSINTLSNEQADAPDIILMASKKATLEAQEEQLSASLQRISAILKLLLSDQVIKLSEEQANVFTKLQENLQQKQEFIQFGKNENTGDLYDVRANLSDAIKTIYDFMKNFEISYFSDIKLDMKEGYFDQLSINTAIENIKFLIATLAQAMKEKETNLEALGLKNQINDIFEKQVLSVEEVTEARRLINIAIDTLVSKINTMFSNILSNWKKHTKNASDEVTEKIHERVIELKNKAQRLLESFVIVIEIKNLLEVNALVDETIDIVDEITFILKNKFKKFPNKFLKQKEKENNDSIVYASLALLTKKIFTLSDKAVKAVTLERNRLISGRAKFFQRIDEKVILFSNNNPFFKKCLYAVNNYGLSVLMRSMLWRGLYRFMIDPAGTPFIGPLLNTFFKSQMLSAHGRLPSRADIYENEQSSLGRENANDTRKQEPNYLLMSPVWDSLGTSIFLYQGLQDMLFQKSDLGKLFVGMTSYLWDFITDRESLNDANPWTASDVIDISTHTLDEPMFDQLRKQEQLEWFEQVIARMQNPLDTTDIARVALFTGQSGSGKTTVVKAFAQTLKNMQEENKLPLHVRFHELEPKHLNVADAKKGIEEQQGDMFEVFMRQGLLDKNSFTILYLDEFHLFFGDKDGQIDTHRLNGFLKLFHSVKTMQKNCNGGLFIILSTNRVELLPSELFMNPSRIERVFRIMPPDYQERINFFKVQLKGVGLSDKFIDLENLSRVLEGLALSQAKLKQIFDIAFNKAKKEGKTITNDHFYDAVNSVIRRIHKDLASASKGVQESSASYYAAQTVVNCLINKYLVFDSATIYPILPEPKPSKELQIHIKDPNRIVQYGALFSWNEDLGAVLYSQKRLLHKALIALAGHVWLQMNDIDMLLQANAEFNLNFKEIKEAYMKNLKEFEHDADEKTRLLFKIAEENLRILFGIDEYRNYIHQVRDLLLNKHFINKQDVAFIPFGQVEAANILLKVH